MGARQFIDETAAAFGRGGVSAGVTVACRELLFGAYHNLPISLGTPVFEREWDALVVLDACRPDLLAEVSADFEFLPAEIPTAYSVASRSDTWMRRNFAPRYREELARTAYVTGNPYTDAVCDPEAFALLDEVWRYAWDEDVGTVRAEPITDRAVAVGRDGGFDRLIVHYMQPHFPSVPEPIAGGIDLDAFGQEWDSVWGRLENGDLSRETVWHSYRENLRYVLDSVQTLLRNLDADLVVLSADHGNALGEWGLYGHPINRPAPVLRRVPWVPVDAEDRGEFTPSLEVPERVGDSDVAQRLEDLGYMT